jgi:hypothetical protein
MLRQSLTPTSAIPSVFNQFHSQASVFTILHLT